MMTSTPAFNSKPHLIRHDECGNGHVQQQWPLDVPQDVTGGPQVEQGGLQHAVISHLGVFDKIRGSL